MQSLPARSSALVFDFDGTIADTRQLIISSYRKAFAQVGLQCPEDERIGSTIGIPLASAFRLLTGQPEAVIQHAVQAYKDIYRTQALNTVTAFNGMSKLLHSCQSTGFRLAIASSRSRSSLISMAEHLGIEKLFEVILSRDDVTNEKPHPEMLLKAAGMLNLNTSDLVMIGDTSFDIDMGTAAGAPTIAVTWGNHTLEQLQKSQPSHIASSVEDLFLVTAQAPAALA